MQLTAERQVVLDEITACDNKIAALKDVGLSGDVGEMGRNAASTLQQTAEVEKIASAKLQKWSQIEAQFKLLQEKATAYKAKNLH